MPLEPPSRGPYERYVESAPLRIEIWREPARCASARVAADFGAIVRSDRVAAMLGSVASSRGVVIAALGEDELRGYAALAPSSTLAGERWESVPDAFELGSIEVARPFRRRGIATALLAHLGAALPIEQLVVFARAFAGHWDTDVAALSPGDYRRMLVRLLHRVGFRPCDTDDPEVSDDPPSFFAVRTGASVASASLLAFSERLVLERRSEWS